MIRSLAVLLVLLVGLAACGDAPAPPPAPTPAPATGFTHSVGGSGAVYYLVGPQQAHPPEGTFPPGTKVRLVSEHGSYARVQSENGTTAYVAAGSLRPLAP